MAITRVGYATTASSSAGTSAVIDMPTGLAAGDFVLIALSLNSTANESAVPTGWAGIRNDIDGNCRLRTYYNQVTDAASLGSTVTVNLTASTDWCAAVVAYRGAYRHGSAAMGTLMDFQQFAGNTETGTDTTLGSGSTTSSYPTDGMRVSFNALTSATGGGWTSITASSGTMAVGANVASSGATPAQLAFADDTVTPPVGAWTSTGTSVASASDKVVHTLVLRPDRYPVVKGTNRVNSGSAGTSGTHTLPNTPTTGKLIFLHFAANNAVTFSPPGDFTQVHATQDGSCTLETYVKIGEASDANRGVAFTISGSTDWTSQSVIWDRVETSVGALIASALDDYKVDTESATDTTITSTSMTAEKTGAYLYGVVAATGVAQTLTDWSTTWPNSVRTTGAATGLSTGSPRVALGSMLHTGISQAGNSGTATATHGVSTSDKVMFFTVLRPSTDAGDAPVSATAYGATVTTVTNASAGTVTAAATAADAVGAPGIQATVAPLTVVTTVNSATVAVGARSGAVVATSVVSSVTRVPVSCVDAVATAANVARSQPSLSPDRSWTVQFESRTFTVLVESRTSVVPDEVRTNTVRSG